MHMNEFSRLLSFVPGSAFLFICTIGEAESIEFTVQEPFLSLFHSSIIKEYTEISTKVTEATFDHWQNFPVF